MASDRRYEKKGLQRQFESACALLYFKWQLTLTCFIVTIAVEFTRVTLTNKIKKSIIRLLNCKIK